MADTDCAATPPRVFLSYSRVDRARVAPIATLLETRGFAVWWDAHIEGGASFARAIAKELEGAQAVVVAWSAESVGSNWVLDEASAARDTGRLVPVALDTTPPPLGFRQFQAIDMKRWRGDAQAPEADSLARAVAAVAGRTSAAGTVSAIRLVRRRWVRPVLAGMAALILAALGWHFLRPRTAAAQPTIAVLPFADMSAIKNPAFADGLAEEILDALARAPGVKVLGRTSAWSLRDRTGDMGLIRDKLGVGSILEGSVRQAGDRIRVSVRLIDTTDGSQLWAQSFERSSGHSFEVQEEIARAVAARVGSTADPAAPPAPKTSAVPGVYEKVFVAKQLIHTRQGPSLERARTILTEAVAADPDYAPAHAALAIATMLLSDKAYGTMPFEIARDRARSHAQRAIVLDANLADGYGALGATDLNFDPPGAIRALTRAVSLDPDDAQKRLELGVALHGDGQLRAAIAEVRRGLDLDPLWAQINGNLVDLLVEAGNTDEAKAVAARFRAISPDPDAVDDVEATVAVGSGDYARPLALVDRALARNPRLSHAANMRARALQAMAAGDRIKATERIQGGEVGRAMADRRYGDVADFFLGKGTGVWNDAHATYRLSQSLILAERPADLVRSFDARFASADAYERAPSADEGTALLVANALRRLGRDADAGALRAFARDRMTRQELLGRASAQNASTWAFLLAEEGDRAGAIKRLRAGVKAQWWPSCSGPVLLDEWLSPTRLARDPAFAPILATCRGKVNEQRRLAGIPPLGN